MVTSPGIQEQIGELKDFLLLSMYNFLEMYLLIIINLELNKMDEWSIVACNLMLK